MAGILELTQSSRTRRSPFYDATIAAGATGFSVYNKMLLPTYYDTPVADYWSLVTGVTMWDVAVERQIEITGPDAHRLVTLMTPRNLSTMQIGQCKYVPLCDERGGLVNDPVLLRLDDDQFWLSIADADVRLWAMGLASGFGLDVRITEPDVSPLAVQGPLADEVAATLLGEWVRELKFFRFRPFDLDGIPLIVARSGWSKQGGFELYLRDGHRAGELWRRVESAGQAWGIRPGAPSSIERIEGGLLSYGNDMTLDHNPFEVGLGRYCDLDQDAEILSLPALREIAERGVERHQIGVVVDGPPIAGNGSWWPLTTADGRRVGDATSVAHSPRLEQNIGLAIVANDAAEPGTTVTVETGDDARRATVTSLPFIN